MFRVTMAQLMQDVSNTRVTWEQKRRVGIIEMIAVTFIFWLFQSSALSQSKKGMTQNAKLKKVKVITLTDAALHPEKFAFHKALDRFNFVVEYRLYSKITTNNIYIIDTTFCNYSNKSDVSPVPCAGHFSARKTICFKGSEIDDAQHSKEPFEAWIVVIKKWQRTRKEMLTKFGQSQPFWICFIQNSRTCLRKLA